MPHCWIALGGNTGDVSSAFRRALTALQARGLTILRRSRYYDTTPVGSAAGARFLNAAAELATDLPPEQVLDVLHDIEAAAGRVRTIPWGPRPLDLDLLLYDDRRIDTPRLTIPHPALWYRRFVLDPLAEIAPQVIHPAFGEPIAALRSRLSVRPLAVAVQGEPAARVAEAIRQQCGTKVAITCELADAGVILHCGGAKPGDSHSNRTVDLGSSSDPVTAACEVLTAALDEPVPLA